MSNLTSDQSEAMSQLPTLWDKGFAQGWNNALDAWERYETERRLSKRFFRYFTKTAASIAAEQLYLGPFHFCWMRSNHGHLSKGWFPYMWIRIGSLEVLWRGFSFIPYLFRQPRKPRRLGRSS